MSEERYAVLVGTSKFPHSRGVLAPLPSVIEDVSAMNEILSDPELGRFNSVKTLLDLPHHEVLLRINQMVHEADRDDLVLIYYSGHGQLDRSGALHLATIDTDPRFLPSTAVASTAVRSLVRECRARRIVIILDCCYSGAIGGIEPTKSVEQSLTGIGGEVTEGYAIFIMAASSAGQQVYAANGDRNGPLTKHILQAIRTGEADSNRDGFVTMNELFEYVCERIVLESRRKPTSFSTGASGPLIIARNRHADDSAKLVDQITRGLANRQRTTAIPGFVVGRMREILAKPVDQIRRHHASVFGLMRDWVKEQISTDEFVNQWYQLDKTGLPESDRPAPAVSRELRWEKVLQCRRPILDYIGPTYVLDNTYHFLDWNPLFDELVAKPMGLVRGRHAEDFILKLQNQRDVIERSRQAFRDGRAPLVDMEPLVFKSPKYGLIHFQKIAAQIPDEKGRPMAWSVMLNVMGAEQDEEMWGDLSRRLASEVNWANYAKSYDQMLLNFRPYRRLIETIVETMGDAQRVADLAAGTGNGTIELLKNMPTRSIWAFESNETMLEYMRQKLSRLPAAERDRVCIFKGDLLVSLREFEEKTFDGAMIINGLYALDDPARCMREINRVLKRGGVVTLSTPTNKTDVDALFRTVRADLEEQGLLSDLRAAVDAAYDRHQAMKANILRDSREDVLTYVKSAGLEIAEVIDDAYAKAVMIVKAVKPELMTGPSTNGKRHEAPQAEPSQPSAPATRAPGQRRNKVFICYSHEDKEWCDRLRTYMTPALRSGSIEVWTDHEIRCGDHWQERIHENLNRSSSAVLLVSPDFLASDYIRNEELPRLLQKAKTDGLVIIPVILRKCFYDHAIYRFPDPVAGPEEFRLAALQTAASNENPMNIRDPGQQGLVLDQVARRLVEEATKRVS
jgi:ubiquinone/menaquinone biosynthesis C-methylase UbiE